MPEFICPYCIKSVLRTAVIYHCPYYGTGRLGCDTDIRSGIQAKPVCPSCNHEVYQQVCPECGSELPDDYAQVNSNMVALVGPTASGKSTYLTVLINELKKETGRKLAITVEYGDDSTQARYENEFYGTLFERNLILPQTPSLSTDLKLRDRPLVFRIAQTRKRHGGIRREVRLDRATLVFFDSSGQDATMGADMTRYLRYLKHAAGIIYLIDPTTLKGAVSDVRPQPQGPVVQPRSPFQVIQDATKTLRTSEQRLIKAPAAVVLAKTDMLKNVVADFSPLGYTRWASGLHPDERDSVNEFVRTLLHRWEMDLDDYMQQNYEKYALFAVSSLGRPPLGQEIAPEGIHPRRVADPLLWMLRELGLLRSLAR